MGGLLLFCNAIEGGINAAEFVVISDAGGGEVEHDGFDATPCGYLQSSARRLPFSLLIVRLYRDGVICRPLILLRGLSLSRG
jgi:hypothetical protein